MMVPLFVWIIWNGDPKEVRMTAPGHERPEDLKPFEEGGATYHPVQLDVLLSLAGVHGPVDPMRLVQPQTVDLIAAQIMAAYYNTGDSSKVEDCATWAYDGARALLAEGMRRDAMGDVLEVDDESKGVKK